MAWTPPTRELTPEDKRAIEGWYERDHRRGPALGDGPGPSRSLALKAWRRAGRVTSAERCRTVDAVSVDLSPHDRGQQEGMREAVLLGKAWGMTKPTSSTP